MKMEVFNKIKDFILWLFFTKRCRYCDVIITKDEELCETCKAELPRISGEKCKFCGAGKNRCTCKKHSMNYDGITAPFYYEKGVKQGLKLFKFDSKTYFANRFAEDMAECIKTDFVDIKFDFVCFVPFTLTQKIERNYNSSELIAEQVANELNIPLQNALVKLFNVKTQHNMEIAQRKGNVHGIYDVKNGFDIKGKTVLLIDDIMTTGETLNNCALIMKIRGAEKVYCATAAITTKKNNKKDH